jgi:signal transduction histidine kinase
LINKIKEGFKSYLTKVYEFDIYMTVLILFFLLYSFHKIDFADTWNTQRGVSWKNAIINSQEYKANKLKVDSYELSQYFSHETNRYNLINNVKVSDEKDDDIQVFKSKLYYKSNNVGFAVIDKNRGYIYTNREWFYDEIKSTGKTPEKVLDDLGYVLYYTTDNVKTFNFYLQENKLFNHDKDVLANFKEVYFIRSSYYEPFIVVVRIVAFIYLICFLWLAVLIYKLLRYRRIYGNKDIVKFIVSVKFVKALGVIKRFAYNVPRIIFRNKKVLIIIVGIYVGIYLLIDPVDKVLYILRGFYYNTMLGGLSGRTILKSYNLGLIVFICIYIMKRMNSVEELIEKTKELASGNLNNKVYMSNQVSEFKEISDNINSIREGYGIVLSNQLKVEKLKTELITNVSHDLRTPLTSIINYVDILKRDDISEEERVDYLEVLSSKSYKLKTLIDDLFEISKMSSGKVKLDKQDLDIVELLYQILGEYTELYEEKGLQFKVSTPDSLIVNLDGYRMSRVISNLIINSIKYSMKDTRIYIDVNDEVKCIKLTFKNIASYEMDFDSDEIFERFVRGDKSRNSDIDGSGLGLAIARSIIELHDGTMNIETEGDMFKVYISIPKDVE